MPVVQKGGQGVAGLLLGKKHLLKTCIDSNNSETWGISLMVYKWGTEASKDSALLMVAAFCVHSKSHPGKIFAS